MKLTYRGISYTPTGATLQAPTTAKYRGQTYTTTHAPASSTSNILNYRGVVYATGTATVGKPSASKFPACALPAFG